MSENRILSKMIHSGEKLFDRAELRKQHVLPKQVVYTRSVIIKSLHYAADELSCSDNIALQDIIIEYADRLVGVREKFNYDGIDYSYAYLETYVTLGIPTKRYDWFLKEAERITKCDIKRNSSFENGEYTWVMAAMYKPVNCYAYSESANDIVPIGILREKMLAVKSNVIGVGHFSVSVCQSRGIKAYYLKFTLNHFQLMDKTFKTRTSLPFIKSEPSTQVTMGSKKSTTH